MTFKTGLIIGLMLFVYPVAGQTHLQLHPMLHLPKDSVLASTLIRSLDGFLGQKEQPNSENNFILPQDLLETSVLVDELKGIERSARYQDSSFYKCYLMNVVPVSKKEFMVQLSYMGTKDNVPYLRASFKLLARQTDQGFFFASPIKANTKEWKSKVLHNYTFYYKNSLDVKQANAYVATTLLYDKKLNAQTEPRKCYYCDHLAEALHIMGVDYKLDYNGYPGISLNARERDTSLLISCYDGTGALFDPHDLWHARLRRVVPATTINKPVDEGCAFLYGGSWGLTWQQIYKLFMERIGSKPDADWLSLYENDQDFGNDPSKPLMANYTINAFIVRQLEKEKGFEAVKELLSCGKYEKTNAQYFKTLEHLTGINRANFNERIGQLIKGLRKA